MIINLLISVIVNLFAGIFYFIPVVTISSIPFIGTDASNILNRAVLIWNAFMVTFPYAQFAWHVFLFAIIPFEILMLLSKFFLGSRSPSN